MDIVFWIICCCIVFVFITIFSAKYIKAWASKRKRLNKLHKVAIVSIGSLSEFGSAEKTKRRSCVIIDMGIRIQFVSTRFVGKWRY